MKENKEKITISMDPELLKRVDRIAEARGDSRSSVIERLVAEGVRGDEIMVSSLEDPVGRAVIAAITTSAPLLNTLVGVVIGKMTAEELAAMKKEAKRQFERGKDRQARKRVSDSLRLGEGLAGA